MEMENAAHAALEGVWLSPNGTRVDIVRDGDMWRGRVYLTRGGTLGSAVYEWNRPEAVREMIQKLERDGNVYQPGMRPKKISMIDEKTDTRIQLIGVIVLLLVLTISVMVLT